MQSQQNVQRLYSKDGWEGCFLFILQSLFVLAQYFCSKFSEEFCLSIRPAMERLGVFFLPASLVIYLLREKTLITREAGRSHLGQAGRSAGKKSSRGRVPLQGRNNPKTRPQVYSIECVCVYDSVGFQRTSQHRTRRRKRITSDCFFF